MSSSPLLDIPVNATSTGLCSSRGGIWPAVQGLLGFLVTNIFAHAATIYLAPGTDLEKTIWMVYQALLLPVKAGDGAFHALGRWWLRRNTLDIFHLFGGYSFEDAATAGAIAVSIPLRFAPLLHGRWDSVEHQRLVMLDNKEFWHSDDADYHSIGNETPFKISNRSSRFVPFILPSRTKFPNYKDYQVSPQSSGLVYTVAVIQLVLSIRQIYQQHNNSIEANGLSSPFLVVVPYMVMTFVNLMANMFVGSYTQIIVLPMEKETLPEDRNDNQVFIGSWGTKGNGEAAQGGVKRFWKRLRLWKRERDDFTAEPVKRVIGVVPKPPKSEVTENDQIDPERPSLIRASPAMVNNPVKSSTGQKVRSSDGDSPASKVGGGTSAPVTSERPNSDHNPGPGEQEDPEPRTFEGQKVSLQMRSNE